MEIGSWVMDEGLKNRYRHMVLLQLEGLVVTASPPPRQKRLQQPSFPPAKDQGWRPPTPMRKRVHKLCKAKGLNKFLYYYYYYYYYVTHFYLHS